MNFAFVKLHIQSAVYRYLNNNYSRLAYPCALDLRKARVLRSSKALSAEKMPSLTESFKEKECVFNLFFLERNDPHAIMDCLFFLFYSSVYYRPETNKILRKSITSANNFTLCT